MRAPDQIVQRAGHGGEKDSKERLKGFGVLRNARVARWITTRRTPSPAISTARCGVDGSARPHSPRGRIRPVGGRAPADLDRPRAAGRPRILILDEVASNIDRPTEVPIEAALDRLLAGRTSIIIAHRRSTVRRADQIAVVEQGRIVQRGRERDLLAQPGPFRDLAREFEIA